MQRAQISREHSQVEDDVDELDPDETDDEKADDEKSYDGKSDGKKLTSWSFSQTSKSPTT